MFVKFILIILLLSIYLINFQFFLLGALAIKPIHLFALVYFIIFIFKKQSLKSKIKFIFILLIILLGYFNSIDKVEFWKSFILVFLSVALIIFGPDLIRKVSIEKKIQFFSFVFKSYVYVVLYGLFQFFTKNFFGLDLLYNNLGPFQFHPHFDNDLFGFTRATSIFYEPSVFGWVTNLVLSLMIIYKERIGMPSIVFYKYLIIFLLGLLVSLSSSAFVSLILICTVYFFIKYKRRVLYLVIIIPFIIIIVWFLLPYLRINEIDTEKSSGYARLILPFLNLEEVINVYPFLGRGLGQFGIDDVKLAFDGVIHNSIFGFFITFGLSGIFLLFMAIKKIHIHYKYDPLSILLWLNLLSILSATGSFLSLELPFIYLIIIAILSIMDINNKYSQNQIQ